MSRNAIAAAIVGGSTLCAVGIVLFGLALARNRQPAWASDPGREPERPSPGVFASEEDRVLQRIASSPIWKRPVSVAEARGWLDQAMTMQRGDTLRIFPDGRADICTGTGAWTIRELARQGQQGKKVHIDFLYTQAPSRGSVLQDFLREVKEAEFRREWPPPGWDEGLRERFKELDEAEKRGRHE